MQHLETCLLLIAETDRVLCHLMMFLNCLFSLDVQNEIYLLSRFFCYSCLVCLLDFWLRNAPLVEVIGNPISDGIVFKNELTLQFWPYLMAFRSCICMFVFFFSLLMKTSVVYAASL